MPTSRPERIDLQLKNLLETLAELEDIAPDWEHEPIHVKLAWYMEWRNDMDILESLQEEYEHGVLTNAQRQTFIDLLSWVQRLLPTIEKLELDMPRVPLTT